MSAEYYRTHYTYLPMVTPGDLEKLKKGLSEYGKPLRLYRVKKNGSIRPIYVVGRSRSIPFAARNWSRGGEGDSMVYTLEFYADEKCKKYMNMGNCHHLRVPPDAEEEFAMIRILYGAEG